MVKEKKKARADESLHEEERKGEPVEEFKIPVGLNKYGFIFVPKKARASLPFEQGVPLKGKIEGGMLIIRAE